MPLHHSSSDKTSVSQATSTGANTIIPTERSTMPGIGLSLASIRYMQQTMGNRAVGRWLSTQLQPAQPRPKISSAVSRKVIQRQVTAQIEAHPEDRTFIGQLRIIGRPERVFSGTMGDHTTAFSVHVEAVRVRVEGRSIVDAVQGMDELAKSAGELAGLDFVRQLPPQHLRKLEEAYLELRGVQKKIKEAMQAEEANAAILLLQEYIAAYLNFRELVPLSLINVKAKSPFLAGKGKGESGKAAVLAAHQNFETVDKEILFDAVVSLFDISSAALASVEQMPEQAGAMAPGLQNVDPMERMWLYVRQHLQSIQMSFPRVFDSKDGLDPYQVADWLLSQVWNEGKNWLVWQQEQDQKNMENRRSEKERLLQEYLLDQALHPGRKRKSKAVLGLENKIRAIEEEIKVLTDSTNRSLALSERIRHHLERFPIEEYDNDPQSEEIDEEFAEEAESDQSQDSEVPEKELEEELEEESEEAEERKQSLATQILLDYEKRTIRDMRSGGRPPSPFSGTMGAHTTAWVVHVDRIRNAIVNKTIGEAFDIVQEQLVPEAFERAERMSKVFQTENWVLDELRRLQDTLSNVPSMGSEWEQALFLQQRINDLLTYINYTPGSTLDSADTGGKAEGRRRGLLKMHESGVPHTMDQLRWAILGLLDLKGADPKAHKLLFAEHLELIQKTYPISFQDSGVSSIKNLSQAREKYANKKGQSKGMGRSRDIVDETGMSPGFDFDFSALRHQEEIKFVDEQGEILPEAQATFIEAYRSDVRQSNAYLTEAEGHFAAQFFNVSVLVYQDLPSGFQRVRNPGGGHCLIHALAQIRSWIDHHVIPDAATNDEIAVVRNNIADQLADEQIYNLCVAAVAARIQGFDEPGLGPHMRELLNSRSVFRAMINNQYTSGGFSNSPSSPKKSDKTDIDIEPQTEPQPQTKLGDGEPLPDVALLFTGGNHYEMIYRS